MRILILDDEPLIAMDLEDIVREGCGAQCVLAHTPEAGLLHVAAGIDFALLDFDLGRGGRTSIEVASDLLRRNVPFCFVSGSLSRLPDHLRGVPQIGKPFHPSEIVRVLPH